MMSESVLRSLLPSIGELLTALVQDPVLRPVISILVWSCNNGIVEAVEALSPYARMISLNPTSKLIRAVLLKSVDMSTLFDLGIRLLKPSISPPVLLRVRVSKAPKSNNL